MQCRSYKYFLDVERLTIHMKILRDTTIVKTKNDYMTLSFINGPGCILFCFVTWKKAELLTFPDETQHLKQWKSNHNILWQKGLYVLHSIQKSFTLSTDLWTMCFPHKILILSNSKICTHFPKICIPLFFIDFHMKYRKFLLVECYSDLTVLSNT